MNLLEIIKTAAGKITGRYTYYSIGSRHCNNIHTCNGIAGSFNSIKSDGIEHSYAVIDSKGVSSGYFVYGSKAVLDCFYVVGLKSCSNCICSMFKSEKSCLLFNKETDPSIIEKIESELKIIIGNGTTQKSIEESVEKYLKTLPQYDEGFFKTIKSMMEVCDRKVIEKKKMFFKNEQEV